MCLPSRLRHLWIVIPADCPEGHSAHLILAQHGGHTAPLQFPHVPGSHDCLWSVQREQTTSVLSDVARKCHQAQRMHRLGSHVPVPASHVPVVVRRKSAPGPWAARCHPNLDHKSCCHVPAFAALPAWRKAVEAHTKSALVLWAVLNPRTLENKSRGPSVGDSHRWRYSSHWSAASGLPLAPRPTASAARTKVARGWCQGQSWPTGLQEDSRSEG
mmetsp:Transcript_76776/g.213354  ORF Transcript_76776/g.213354 Transcript_76776/m.213354 type:complete len:215 (+) Transcript_76776:801-1445(+)